MIARLLRQLFVWRLAADAARAAVRAVLDMDRAQPFELDTERGAEVVVGVSVSVVGPWRPGAAA